LRVKPREFMDYYTVTLAVDSLPFTAASTATAVLPRVVQMRFDWLTDFPLGGIASGDRIA